MSTASQRPVLACLLVALAATPLACAFNTHGDVPAENGGGSPTSSTTTDGGGGAGTFCKPGETSPCYTGPSPTLNIGICKAGTKTCDADGSKFGVCVGEVKPAPADDCTTMLDENCDGTPNEACPCTPGTMQACYTGPAGTSGVGPCHGGMQACNGNGEGFGPCNGEALPTAEDCTTDVDEDCNGKIFDDAAAGCVCNPASMPVSCYTGPAQTMGVGVCVGGMETCNPDGKGTSGCVGEVTPKAEDCSTPVDDDCNGKAVDDAAAGCVCAPGSTMACGTGLMGACANGTQTCAADGKSWGGCNAPAPATEDCATSNVDESCDGDNTCNGGTLAGKIKGASGKEDFTYGVAFDPSGNYIAGGILDGTFGSGFNGGSIWLAKYPATGAANAIWEKTFTPTGAGAYAVINSVATDAAGNIFAGGEFKGTLVIAGTTLVSDTAGGGIDAILLKLDPNGNVTLVKSFGAGSTQTISSVAVDGGGNVILAGSMGGTADFGGGTLTAGGLSYDVFVAKLTNNGAHAWSKRAGDNADQSGLGVAAMPGGDVVVVGAFAGHLNFGTDMDAGTDDDVFVVRLQGNTGNEVWSKQYGDNMDQAAFAVAVDAQSNVVVSGRFDGNINFGPANVTNGPGRDVFVAKLAADGSHVWSKGFGGADSQNSYGVAVDGLGNVVVTGSFETLINFGSGDLTNPSNSSPDIFVAKLVAGSGAQIWAKSFGDGTNSQYGYAVAVDKVGNIALGGAIRGSADFGAPVGVLTSAGGYDLYAVKLKP